VYDYPTRLPHRRVSDSGVDTGPRLDTRRDALPCKAELVHSLPEETPGWSPASLRVLIRLPMGEPLLANRHPAPG
jgi:hypothetical protein